MANPRHTAARSPVVGSGPSDEVAVRTGRRVERRGRGNSRRRNVDEGAVHVQPMEPMHVMHAEHSRCRIGGTVGAQATWKYSASFPSPIGGFAKLRAPANGLKPTGQTGCGPRELRLELTPPRLWDGGEGHS